MLDSWSEHSTSREQIKNMNQQSPNQGHRRRRANRLNALPQKAAIGGLI
jgi:hypothetical protein